MIELLTKKNRVLVTGGSGFIGTNLLDNLIDSGAKVLNIDINEPLNAEHHNIYEKGDILDFSFLNNIFGNYAPTHVVHLAARTDLGGKSMDDYKANIEGVKNITQVVSQHKSVLRSIFISTKLVCPTDYSPKSEKDYCPDTLYGESKVEGERIVSFSQELNCGWCIVRPTSIWGPWSNLPHIPYGKFFLMISRGNYFHPGKINPPKSFGYVGNTVYQILKLLEAPREKIHGRIFYLSDYEIFTIKEWADLISVKLRGKKVPTLPEPMVNVFARIGDFMKFCGIKEPPFSSFRLRNMRADTSQIPLESIKQITGPLPYTIEQGVEETIAWFRKFDLI